MTWALLKGFLFGAEKSKQTHWKEKHFIVTSIITTIMSKYNVLSLYQALLYHLYLSGNKVTVRASPFYFLTKVWELTIGVLEKFRLSGSWAKDLWCFISRCSLMPLGPLLSDRAWTRMTQSRVDSPQNPSVTIRPTWLILYIRHIVKYLTRHGSLRWVQNEM